MYKEYFGLKSSPFSIAPDPQFLYMSDRHREALAHLLYGIQSDGGFILLTGEVGTGKTTVCRCLLQQLPLDVDTAYILNPKLTALEMLMSVCDDLGITYPTGASIKVLVDCLNQHLLSAYQQDRRTVVIIDEAQNLSIEVLEQLRLLTNLETNERKLLQIILLGQPELLEMLDRKDLRQLSQRITARFHLDALRSEEVEQYIAHRLEVAGGKPALFQKSAIKQVYRLSEGIPRLINLICDRALLGTYAGGRLQVDATTVGRAAQEVLGKRRAYITATAPAVSVAAVLLLSIFGFGWLYLSDDRLEHPGEPQIAAAPVIDSPVQEILPLIETPEIEQEPIPIAVFTEEMVSPVSDSLSQVRGEDRFDVAINALFDLWQAPSVDPYEVAPCTEAPRFGLSCLSVLGSLRDLRQFNHPAVVRLTVEGVDHYVNVTGMTDSIAVLSSGRGQWRIDHRDLIRAWDGNFTVLWKPPVGFTTVKPGDFGQTVDQLYAAMHKVDGQRPDVQSGTPFDQNLETRLIRFQIESGLRPDGIAGEQTWIHLNSSTVEDNTPLLSTRESRG